MYLLTLLLGAAVFVPLSAEQIEQKYKRCTERSMQLDTCAVEPTTKSEAVAERASVVCHKATLSRIIFMAVSAKNDVKASEALSTIGGDRASGAIKLVVPPGGKLQIKPEGEGKTGWSCEVTITFRK